MIAVLWDVDGTLVDVRGAGRRAFAVAIERTWGVRLDLSDVKIGGATDLGILDELRGKLTRNHAGDALDVDREARFFEVMGEVLDELLSAQPAHALPGAREIVREIAESARNDVVQGLLTGNGKALARAKLTSAGIDPSMLMAVGAFGDEHADRCELARRARARAPAHARVVVVGDTPRDVEAARAIGARSVCVCTGSFDADALARAGADLVIEDLQRARADLSSILR